VKSLPLNIGTLDELPLDDLDETDDIAIIGLGRMWA